MMTYQVIMKVVSELNAARVERLVQAGLLRSRERQGEASSLLDRPPLRSRADVSGALQADRDGLRTTAFRPMSLL